MIIDITGVELIPGNYGNDCPGNGENPDVECCCDECDYMRCCLEPHTQDQCDNCHAPYCPHVKSNMKR